MNVKSIHLDNSTVFLNTLISKSEIIELPNKIHIIRNPLYAIQCFLLIRFFYGLKQAFSEWIKLISGVCQTWESEWVMVVTVNI